MQLVRTVSALVALAFVACTQVNTQWNLDAQGDLAGRRTFSLHGLAEEPGDFSDASPADWKRRQGIARTLILSELTAKGYRQTTGSPDFLVHFVAGVQPRDGTFGGADAGLEGEIDIRAVDPTTKRFLWQGWATETLTSKLDRDEEVRKAVREILAQFPAAS